MIGNREGSDVMRAMRSINGIIWICLHRERGTLSVEIESFLEIDIRVLIDI